VKQLPMLALTSCSGPSFAAPLAPATRAARGAASPTMGVETELGATGPLGYWDPFGFVRRCPRCPCSNWAADWLTRRLAPARSPCATPSASTATAPSS